ncbi:hypothetical protein B0H11DRAFT_1930760 [Mycena galericulata]|nr:hypothetical protein B0H11DRAFT_1930760 [Mycena galericulata]
MAVVKGVWSQRDKSKKIRTRLDEARFQQHLAFEHSFLSQTRTERNTTEAVIKKCCDDAVHKFVMREVRKDGASGARAKFRKACAALQIGWKKTADRKKDAAIQLPETELEFDKDKIREFSFPHLQEQLHVYCDVLKDPTLSPPETVEGHGNSACAKRIGVGGARASKDPSLLISSPCSSEPDAIVEYGYSLGDEADVVQ